MPVLLHIRPAIRCPAVSRVVMAATHGDLQLTNIEELAQSSSHHPQGGGIDNADSQLPCLLVKPAGRPVPASFGLYSRRTVVIGVICI
jgi:hypothetical protein